VKLVLATSNKGKVKEIKEYCEGFEVIPYWLYLKHELLKGNINQDDYLDYLHLMSEELDESKSYTLVFVDGVKEELSNS